MSQSTPWMFSCPKGESQETTLFYTFPYGPYCSSLQSSSIEWKLNVYVDWIWNEKSTATRLQSGKAMRWGNVQYTAYLRLFPTGLGCSNSKLYNYVKMYNLVTLYNLNQPDTCGLNLNCVLYSLCLGDSACMRAAGDRISEVHDRIREECIESA